MEPIKETNDFIEDRVVVNERFVNLTSEDERVDSNSNIRESYKVSYGKYTGVFTDGGRQ